MKCDACGCEEFVVTGTAHDLIRYSATVDDDGSITTERLLKDECGDTDWDDKISCESCGKEYILPDRRAKYIAVARAEYEDDDVKISDDAEIEPAEDGFWIEAHLWVPNGEEK